MIFLPLRTKIAVFAVLGGLLTAAANNPKQGGPVSLSAKISQVKDRLVIDYSFENKNVNSIYLWDVMTNIAGDEQIVDPALAYVFWEEPNTVRVVRAVLDEPPNVHPVVRELPFVRKVSGHEIVRGQISFALPLQEYSPFYSPASQFKPIKCESVHLIIGWIEHREGMVLSERKVGGQTVLALRGSWPRPAQHLAEKILPVSEVLSVRQDDFDRRLPPH